VQFVVGIYKLADLCESGQDMVMHRLTLLKGHLSELIGKMSVEHYGEGSSKLPLLFKVNNVHYICRALSQLGLQKSGAKDLSSFEKELDNSIESLIDVLLQENFVGLEQFIGTYSKKTHDDSGEANAELQDLAGVNKKQLESVAQDFSFNYKQKADFIAKELRLYLQDNELVNSVGQRLMRVLSLNYGTFCEIVRSAHPGYLKELPTTKQVLLDLKNTALNI
jgi:hypothetical protein